MAALQIIGVPQSNFVRVVRMAAHEKGVPYEFISAPPHSPEVKEIHPAGKIPVMRHGDVTLFESRAIAHYIDEHFEGPPLTLGDKHLDAKVEQWISYVTTVSDQLLVRRYLFAYVFPKTADKKPDRPLIEELLPAVAREIEVLDGAINANGFLVGDRFSLADMYLLPIVHFARRLPETGEMIAKSKNLARYYERHKERESFKATEAPARKAA
ncbi:MAG TPA: glutathione S-transferase family protein [Xanthobacteraceae bacterium]|jgi:glutathione S-transferase|nr:glutathione S-transferase family protein [Xanthobacteraceae bacterium]